MNKLINCGCGGEAVTVPETRDGYISYYCTCLQCNLNTDYYESPEKAATAWNKAMGVKDVNVFDKEIVIVEPFTTDMNHVGYCKCGYLVNAEWKYCPLCGATLEWTAWAMGR